MGHSIFVVFALILLWGGIAAKEDLPASTRATTADGTLSIQGIAGRARHTHGGAPAHLGHATFEISNQGKGPRTVEVTTVEFLTGKDCEYPPDEVTATPAPAGLLADDGIQRESTKSITVPAKTTVTVTAGFTPAVEAYYVYCDRFAFRLGFAVDGEKTPLSVTAETTVMRVTPIRN